MNTENNREVIFFEDDGEYIISCNICDKLCIERFLITIILNRELNLLIFIKTTTKIKIIRFNYNKCV